MKISWLAQGGLFFEMNDGTTVMVDPYLTNDMEDKRGPMFKRLVPVDSRFLNVRVDVLILTHNHMDHTDIGTLTMLFKQQSPMTILSARSVWEKIYTMVQPGYNPILFDYGCEATIGNMLFRSIYALHSDLHAIGVHIEAEDTTIFISGDTLYNRRTISEIREVGGQTDLAFVCINGRGNNLNIKDAVRMMREINPLLVVPVHWDLFEEFKEDPELFISMLKNSGIRAVKMIEYQPYSLMKLKNIKLVLCQE